MSTPYLISTANQRRKSVRRSRLATIALLAMWGVVPIGLPATGRAQTEDVIAKSTSDLATVSASASASQVQVAEPLTVELRVTAPAGTKVSLPAIGSQLGQFDIVDQRDVLEIPSEDSPDERVWTRHLTLESIVTGDLQIPAMEIQAVKGSNSQTVRSKSIPVRVLSVLEGRADPTQFRDIHPVVDVRVPPQTSYAWVWWTAGGLGILALGIAAIAVVVRRRNGLTPERWALHELNALQDSMSMRKGNSEQVSLRLTSILRNFLELQMEVPAPAQTTEELLEQMTSQQILDLELAARFGKWFQAADLTKFAGWQLSTNELSDAVVEARELVIQTAREMESQSRTSAPSLATPESN